jgi:hypothetical protein
MLAEHWLGPFGAVPCDYPFTSQCERKNARAVSRNLMALLGCPVPCGQTIEQIAACLFGVGRVEAYFASWLGISIRQNLLHVFTYIGFSHNTVFGSIDKKLYLTGIIAKG